MSNVLNKNLKLKNEFTSIVFRLINVDSRIFSAYFHTFYLEFTSIRRKIFYVS